MDQVLAKYRCICGILYAAAYKNEIQALLKDRGGLFMLKMKPQEVYWLCQLWKARGLKRLLKMLPYSTLFWEICHLYAPD